MASRSLPRSPGSIRKYFQLSQFSYVCDRAEAGPAIGHTTVGDRQDQILRKALERSQAETILAQIELEIARFDEQQARIESTSLRLMIGALRDELEFVEGEYRETLEVVAALRGRVRACDGTIVALSEHI